MSRILVAAIATALAAGQASAATFAGDGVDITNAAARIHVVPEDRTDIAVEAAPGQRIQAPSVRVSAGHVVIDGGLNGRIHGCNSFQIFTAQPVARVNIWGVGNVPVSDLPQITLRVPHELNLSASGAIFGDVSASSGGRVNFHGCGDVTMEDTSGPLDAMQNGSGDLTIGHVGGALRARLDGSGDVRVASANGDASAELNGSGDINIGAVRGHLRAHVDGSGDVDVASAAGADVNVAGSGDATIGPVNGPLRARLDGSGDITVASASGNLDLGVAGSGDLLVRGGNADQLNAALDGSGSINFRGHAKNVTADLGGSGDIDLASGGEARNIHDHGSGEVHIGR